MNFKVGDIVRRPYCIEGNNDMYILIRFTDKNNCVVKNLRTGAESYAGIGNFAPATKLDMVLK